MQRSEIAHQEIRRQIQRASIWLAGSLLLSRVVGFFREWILAQLVGVSELTDVFYASFSVPDFLSYLMAAGALGISFIPIFAEALTNESRERANDIFRWISTYVGSLFLLLTGIAYLWTEPLARWIAPGFSESQIALLITLIRIILPSQLFFFWGALAMAVQQTHGRFLCSALAPIFYNLSIITCGALFSHTLGVRAFSVGVLVGAFLGNGLLQAFALRALGYSMLPLWRLEARGLTVLKRYARLSLPVMLGFSIVVTDEWIAKYFASLGGSKAISWLAYARIELRVPMAIIGQVAGVASYPYLSRLWSSGDRQNYVRTLLHECLQIFALSSVATVFTISYALPITHFLFGGSRFTPADFTQTSIALQMYSIGLLFWVLQILLARAFYARQKTWLPSLVGTGVSVIAIPIYQTLGGWLSFAGLALSGSVGVTIYCIALGWVLLRDLKEDLSASVIRRSVRFTILWSGVTGLMYLLCQLLRSGHLYQGTQLSGLADVVLGLAVVGMATLLLLRKAFARLTDGPLL